MKNIFRIFRRDLINLFTNVVAIIVISGLVILPSLYAWFNIKASWDPYSNTNGIKVAIVNEDSGANFNGKDIVVADEIVNTLKQNTALGWHFVTEEDANKGLDKGTYYASITFPKDFTNNVLSLISKDITNPEIIYKVNEKVNAIAPKITDKGVSTIKSQVDSTIISTVNGIIFKIFNEAGYSLENLKPELRKIIDSLINVNNDLPDFETILNNSYDSVAIIEDLTSNIKNDLPSINDTLTSTEELLNSTKEYLEKSKEVLDTYAPTVKEDIGILNDKLTSIANILNSITNIDKDNVINILTTVNNDIVAAKQKIDSIVALLKPLSKLNPQLKTVIEELNNLNSALTGLNNKITSLIPEIEGGNLQIIDNLNEIKKLVTDLNSIVSRINSNFDTAILPEINSGIDSITSIANNTLDLINKAQASTPIVDELLDKLNISADLGGEKLLKLKDLFPVFKNKVNEITTKLQSLDENAQIEEILKIMTNDWKKESDFLASPIDIVEERLYPIPNYGSGMSPFFTILSLWVGALILVSLLTVDAHRLDPDVELKPYEKYFGKLLLFATLGILQALVVTLGDIFLLKTYVLNPIIFVLWGCFSSFVFVLIIYTLVSIFDNVGKALGVILLVLQISASGGTFPIEVAPKFFKMINPYLPFTYAISGMREAVGGIVKEVIIKDLLALSIYIVFSLVLALLLKKPINKASEKLVKRLKESNLLGH